MEYKELVWLVGNLNLEVIEYSRQIYRPRGYVYPGDDDDGDDLEMTLSYRPRKRHY